MQEGTPIAKAKGGWIRTFECRCQCGDVRTYRMNHLTSGASQSCGCLKAELTSERSYQHGMSKHPLMGIWGKMIGRCTNPNTERYLRYGGRGIKVCTAWSESALEFMQWCLANGWKKGLQIDREDNDGDYEPSNCRFITGSQNSRNRSNNRLITWNGRTCSLAEQCEILGLDYAFIHNRISKGWTAEEALTCPSGMRRSAWRKSSESV